MNVSSGRDWVGRGTWNVGTSCWCGSEDPRTSEHCSVHYTSPDMFPGPVPSLRQSGSGVGVGTHLLAPLATRIPVLRAVSGGARPQNAPTSLMLLLS